MCRRAAISLAEMRAPTTSPLPRESSQPPSLVLICPAGLGSGVVLHQLTRQWPTTPSRRRPGSGRPRPGRPSRRTNHLHGRESPRSQPSRRPHSLLFWAGATTAVPKMQRRRPRHAPIGPGGCQGARRGIRCCGQCSPHVQQDLLQTKLVPGGRGGRCRRRLDGVGGRGVPGRRRPRSVGSCTSRDSMTRGDCVNSHS